MQTTAPISTTEQSQTKRGKDKAFAANFLGVSIAHMNRMIHERRGPRYRKVGRLVRYDERDLQSYWDNLPTGGEVA